jgi:ribosomal protein S27AE
MNRERRPERLEYKKAWRLAHLSYTSDYGKKYREKNKEKIRKYYREWYRKNGRKRPDDYYDAILEYQRIFPERLKIYQQLMSAIRSGKVKKHKNCFNCGSISKVQAHHLDYKHFMNFIWLCSSCHKLAHSK